MQNERKCRYCQDPIPEGTPGPFCSNEHKWLYGNSQQMLALANGYDVVSSLPGIPGVWGKSPRNRGGKVTTH